MKRLKITSEQCHEEALYDLFASAIYPLTVTVTNHMPRAFRYAPLGIDLACNMADDNGLSESVNIVHFGQLQRLCTDAATIGELNGFQDVIDILWKDPTTQMDGATPSATPSAEAEATQATSKKGAKNV